DAAIAPSLLQKTLREVAGRTFNAISVDGDTSTNDTLLVLANGEAGAPSIKAGTSAHRAFAAALEDVCRSLALQIVADGEGAQPATNFSPSTFRWLWTCTRAKPKPATGPATSPRNTCGSTQVIAPR